MIREDGTEELRDPTNPDFRLRMGCLDGPS